MNRQRLGEILVEMAAIQPRHLNAALARQKRFGHKLGRCLTDIRACSEDMIVAGLGQQYGLATTLLNGRSIPESLTRLIPARLARELRAIPLAVIDGAPRASLRIAMTRPWDITALEQLRDATGFKILAILVGDLDMAGALNRYYPRGAAANDFEQKPVSIDDELAEAAIVAPIPGWEELTLPPSETE